MENFEEKVYKLKARHTFMVTRILKAINLDIKEIVIEGVTNLKLMTNNVSSSKAEVEEATEGATKEEATKNPMLKAAEIWSGLATKVVTEIIYNYENTEKDLIALISSVSGLTKKQVEELDLEEYFDILTYIFYRDNNNFFKRYFKSQTQK